MVNKNYAIVMLDPFNDLSSVNIFTNISENKAIKYTKEIAEKIVIKLKEELNIEAEIDCIYKKSDYESDLVDYITYYSIKNDNDEYINIFLKEAELNNTNLNFTYKK